MGSGAPTSTREATMRISLAVSCLLGAALLATAPRAATLDYAWDTAVNPVTNESFAGPIQ